MSFREYIIIMQCKMYTKSLFMKYLIIILLRFVIIDHLIIFVTLTLSFYLWFYFKTQTRKRKQVLKYKLFI